MKLRKLQNLVSILSLGLISTGVCAADITSIIAENIKGTKILNVTIEPIPHDADLMLVVKTSAGERKFIMSKEDIVTALAMLQNPESYGATNALLVNRTIPHLPTAQPLALAQNPAQPLVAQRTPATPTPSEAAPVPTNAPTTTASAATTPQQLTPLPTTVLPSQAPAVVSSLVLSANQQASK